MVNKKVVCLGGGIGTVNLIKGLKNYFTDIAVVISMADDGGSAGRLRRLFNILPPGDLVSCMAASLEKKNPILAKILKYRFKGDRYGDDAQLSGQKLGNLIMIAVRDIAGSFEKAIKIFQKTFNIKGTFLPATLESVSISAKTIEGKIIHGEENIDLGKYPGKRILDTVFLNPSNAAANKKVLKSLKDADVIIAGPGDLYTTVLPVLIVRDIKTTLIKSKAKKIFVVNVANKPFETNGYGIADYIKAIEKHLGCFPFDMIIVNNNFAPKIPKQYSYDYVDIENNNSKNYKSVIIEKDIVDEAFPLYHDSLKLAKAIIENI